MCAAAGCLCIRAGATADDTHAAGYTHRHENGGGDKDMDDAHGPIDSITDTLTDLDGHLFVHGLDYGDVHAHTQRDGKLHWHRHRYRNAHDHPDTNRDPDVDIDPNKDADAV